MTRATFAVLDKTFSDPDLPPTWRARREQAYSRGFLRAAAQAYTARDFERGADFMREAVRLCPDLCANGAELLARLAAGWANHSKTAEPLRFLSAFYAHLPEELSALRRRRSCDLAREARQLAFAAYKRGDTASARSALWQAIMYRPDFVFNRGVLSILVRTTRSFLSEANRGA